MKTQNLSGWTWLYRLGGAAALFAMCTNLLDIILGFRGAEAITYGSRSAIQWFAIYQESAFQGLYSLGILNIVYMIAMLPLYFALMVAHRQKQIVQAIMVVILFLLAMSIYLSTNAALPLWVVSTKYALADTQAQKDFFLAAGEAVLARGEDFTPGSFMPLFLSGFAALSISLIMLRGGMFGKATSWIGLVGFTFLSLFTICATFVPALYPLAFYGFASLGGILVLTWFALVARRLFQLARVEKTVLE